MSVYTARRVNSAERKGGERTGNGFGKGEAKGGEVRFSELSGLSR